MPIALIIVLAGCSLRSEGEMGILLVSEDGVYATLLFLAVTFAGGHFLGGSEVESRTLLGLGTAQRNISAALLVAVGNFSDDPNVLAMIMVAGWVWCC